MIFYVYQRNSFEWTRKEFSSSLFPLSKVENYRQLLPFMIEVKENCEDDTEFGWKCSIFTKCVLCLHNAFFLFIRSEFYFKQIYFSLTKTGFAITQEINYKI